MVRRTRREFLADTGRGMLIASLGAATAHEMGVSTAWAEDGPAALDFGPLESLVALMQETPAAKLLPVLADKLSNGSDLKTLIAAGALANARTFGGQDYTGYHAFMALAPALAMTQELPESRRALPVLKVLYRNTNRMQQQGGRKNEVLHPLSLPCGDRMTGEQFRESTRKADFGEAELKFGGLWTTSPSDAFDHLQYAVQDEVDVHRVVLAWRAKAMLDVTGIEHGHTLLRQSVRFCVQAERDRIDRKRETPGIRAALPKLLDQYKLVGNPIGNRQPDDAWVEHLSQTICNGTREQAADAVAAAIAEGMATEAIGEAISLAANQLVLRDPGRAQRDGDKEKGSVHGASVGVHASDSANAWRNITRVCNTRNKVTSLIVGAYHTGGQRNGLNPQPFPLAEHTSAIKVSDATALLRETEGAIKDKDQARACALAHHYCAQNHPIRPLFDVLLRFAVSEDGALHAEKYYRTVVEEYATTRPAFRSRHVAALARVTASECGHPAPGYAEACRLMKA